MTRPAAFDAALLAQTPFLHRMASAMVYDAHEREDAVNDTIELALRWWRQYRSDGNMRGWLRLLMRSALQKKYRYKKGRHENARHAKLPQHLSNDAQEETAAEARLHLAQLTDSRADTALLRAAKGESLGDIGADLGISKQRVQQITAKARRDFAARIGWGE